MVESVDIISKVPRNEINKAKHLATIILMFEEGLVLGEYVTDYDFNGKQKGSVVGFGHNNLTSQKNYGICEDVWRAMFILSEDIDRYYDMLVRRNNQVKKLDYVSMAILIVSTFRSPNSTKTIRSEDLQNWKLIPQDFFSTMMNSFDVTPKDNRMENLKFLNENHTKGQLRYVQSCYVKYSNMKKSRYINSQDLEVLTKFLDSTVDIVLSEPVDDSRKKEDLSVITGGLMNFITTFFPQNGIGIKMVLKLIIKLINFGKEK